MPRIAATAEDEGFSQQASSGERRWEWVKPTSPTVRAAVLLSEMTPRNVRDGVDVQAYGAIYLDQVEQRLHEDGQRHPDAATLMAPLRAWGSTFTRDGAYRFRRSADPESRVEELAGDLRSFAAFATAIRDVTDLSEARLARSRIRRHVTAGLAPGYAAPQVASLIAEMNTNTETGVEP
ncbi:hypothetical protein RR49_01753 [Microbacterium ginsengisoli]|uniref:Uncharacterized protein n=2 Tax=Actinomycetota TaxID=201174 RepID=A0A0F0LT43_9MICO|nr:hypothetical protein RR49_01753 [Microbacterium ginsengisoli]